MIPRPYLSLEDHPLLSNQDYSSDSQDSSLTLLIQFLQLLSPDYLQGRLSLLFLWSLLWHLSGLILLRICRAFWKLIPSCPLSSQAFIPSYVNNYLSLWLHLDCPRTPVSHGRVSIPSKNLLLVEVTYFAQAITAASMQNI